MTPARPAPTRQPTRQERRAADRRAFLLQAGPHALVGDPWQDPAVGDPDTRDAGGAWRARSGCGRTLPAGLTTGDPRKVKCPKCKETGPVSTPTPEERTP